MDVANAYIKALKDGLVDDDGWRGWDKGYAA